MATKKPAEKQAPDAKKPSTALVNWEAELSKAAAAAAETEASTVTSQLYSLKSGVLSFGDNMLPGNKIAAIIVDHVLENIFYEDPEYDSENPKNPTCFAFGRDDKTMGPHESVVKFGSSQAGRSGICAGCEKNEWGSADKGRGKACKNIRRLAIVQAGTYDAKGNFNAFDAESLSSNTIGYMKLPVTSAKGWATYVKQLNEQLRRPPFGVVTLISLTPDPKTQFKVNFEVIEEVAEGLMETVFTRHNEAKLGIEFEYALGEQEEKPKKAGKTLSKAAKPLSALPGKNKKY